MFTQGLVMDLIRNPGGNEWRLSLVDTDPIALESIARLVRKMLDAQGSSIELSSSVERAEELPGADYVVLTIGVGGRRAWEQDVLIPRKYGVFQPVGDTAMPGGISRTMRMVPAILDIVRDVMAICPGATLINYSNPMTNICRAVNKATGHQMTGLCIGTEDSVRFLARLAGVERSEVSYQAAGLNHLTFIYDLRSEGADLMPLALENYGRMRGKIDPAKIGDSFLGAEAAELENQDPFGISFMEKYHAFPAPGDRHTTEFFTERFPSGVYYGHKLGVDAYSFEGTIRYGDRIYEEAANEGMREGPLPEGYLKKLGGEQEQLMEIINSMEKDERKSFSANVVNGDAVPNLPRDAIVEIPALASAGGFRRVAQAGFPDALAGITLKFIGISEVAVEAALRGDRRLFAEAILLGGYLPDEGKVNRMVDELIQAQSKYLPQF
jgi:alpha-galactosidase